MNYTKKFCIGRNDRQQVAAVARNLLNFSTRVLGPPLVTLSLFC